MSGLQFKHLEDEEESNDFSKLKVSKLTKEDKLTISEAKETIDRLLADKKKLLQVLHLTITHASFSGHIPIYVRELITRTLSEIK